MAESMFKQAKMDNARERDHVKADKEERQQRYELERQQRDHHHAAEMARSEVLINESKERLLRLQLEMSRQ